MIIEISSDALIDLEEGFLQSNFQLALPQPLIRVGFHRHKPQFASHAQSHLPFVLQRP